MDKVLLELLVRVHDFVISRPVNKTGKKLEKLERNTCVILTMKIDTCDQLMKGQFLSIYDFAACQETVTTVFVNFDDSITNSK